MIIFKKLCVILIAVSMISFGCGRNSSSDLPPVSEQQLWTMPDTDTDGIPDTYDFPDNTKTQEIPCPLEDGTVTYMDCSTTADCDCDKVADNIQIHMVSKCGWGCVAGNARTYVMIGTGLSLAYIGYAFFSKKWPFGEDKNPEDGKDSKGNPIEYTDISPADIDRANSNTRLEQSGTSFYMTNYIRSQKCKSNLRPTFECASLSRYNMSGFSLLSTPLPPTYSTTVTTTYTGDSDTSKFNLSSASDNGGSTFMTWDSGNTKFVHGSALGSKSSTYKLDFKLPLVIGTREGYSEMTTETEAAILESGADNDPAGDPTFEEPKLPRGTHTYRPINYFEKGPPVE